MDICVIGRNAIVTKGLPIHFASAKGAGGHFIVIRNVRGGESQQYFRCSYVMIDIPGFCQGLDAGGTS